jgi:DtxR family Mn-dependent transcriptional regulator
MMIDPPLTDDASPAAGCSAPPGGAPSRSDSHTPAVEDYIKHIWKLVTTDRRATTKAIAERMELGRGTVTEMLQHLATRGLVQYEPYRGVELTEAGTRLALRIVRRHRLIELFLVRTLGLGWEEVHRDAEKLEHVVSDELIERMDAFLGHPDVDPHGAPIPSAAGEVAKQDFSELAGLAAGESGVVRRVSDHEPQFLKYLDEAGITLDAAVHVTEVGPYGAMKLRVGGRETHLAREGAQRIFVSKA